MTVFFGDALKAVGQIALIVGTGEGFGLYHETNIIIGGKCKI